jgi:DNA-directed RNA polymerase subunit RPC12/RpoP
MKFPCPECSQRLSADESMVGQSLECPRCGHMLTVPPSGEEPAKSVESGKPAGKEWVNPLKPAKEKQRATKGGTPSSPKRPGTSGRRTPATTIIISDSGGGWTKLLLVVVLLLGAGFAYWKYNGGSFQRVVQYQAEPEVAPSPTQEAPRAPEPLPSIVTEPSVPKENGPSAFGTSSPQAAEIQSKPDESTAASGFGSNAKPTPEPSVATASTPTPSTGTELESIPMDQATPAAHTKETETSRGAFPTGNLMPVTLNQRQQSAALSNRRVTLSGSAQVYLTAEGDPLPGSVLNFASPDAWLFLEKIRPSKVASDFLSRMWVNGSPAELDKNIRVVQYEQGTVVIPHAPDYPAMTVFNGKGANGTPMRLTCYTKYDDEALGPMKGAISSFRLKRGYMATIAQNENGTGISKNYVAQDQDIEVSSLPAGLDKSVRFIRIFPWRWTSKKGIAGGIWQKLNVDWFYDWNIGANSSLDLEYVPIKQKRYWPGLNQDWKRKGSVHLLGYNEPDRPDQAKMTPDEAIAGWPELLGTGLRLGSPAVSDGGLGWLYEFMEKADDAKLRVDFIAVHYYRATPGNNPRAAANQMHDFLKEIHDRTKRPIWITEWNNGANWTSGDDPSTSEQKECIEEMIKMLDKTEFVERYAIYNWVEDCRHVLDKNGQPTPAGKVYRDKKSPLAYEQSKR